jgi:D-serine deaminase-like pyridoxal phosphate-dependent protein
MAENEARTMAGVANRCRKAGVTIEESSAGATPPARFSIQQEGFTEYRPGNYVYFDRTQVALGAAAFDDCALTVLATVVSKPAADRVIFDSGSKTLTNDGARGFTPAPGYGIVIDHPNLLIERLSEEHATVKVEDGRTTLEPGDRVRIIPNHSCVVSNLVDQAWLVDGDNVEALPIAARGRIT